MGLNLWAVTFILGCVAKKTSGIGIPPGKDPGRFNSAFYRGPIPKSVVALRHRSSDFHTSMCYATLVNWQVAVTPCSCAVKPLSANDQGVWYDHNRKRKVSPEDPSTLKALAMEYEYHEQNIIDKVMVPLRKITLHPNCDAGFQYNVARIELSKPVHNSKLAWVATPFQNRMKDILNEYGQGTIVIGECEIYRWKLPSDDPLAKDIKSKLKARIDTDEVIVRDWPACKDVVCPTKPKPPKGKKIVRDPKICANNVTKSRVCLEWDNTDALCDVIPGTPIFCHSSRLIGLSGFMHNASMLCDSIITAKNGVMEGIDLALPLIKYDLRVIHQYKNLTGL